MAFMKPHLLRRLFSVSWSDELSAETGVATTSAPSAAYR